MNIIASSVVVLALCLSALLLFAHRQPPSYQQRGIRYPLVNGQPQAQDTSSVINPLPAIPQPPVLRDQLPYGEDASAHEIPTFGLDQSTVYATDGLFSIYELQASTGLQLRRIAVKGVAGWSVLASNGVLYTIVTPSENGYAAIQAWDSRSGSLLWSRTLWGQSFGGSAVLDALPPLVLANGVVYICASPGGGHYTIYALHANDGTPLWSHDLNTGMLPEPLDRITFADGVIYMSSSENRLVALNAQDGSLRWDDGPAGVNSLPTVVDGIVYVSINTQYDLGPHVDDFAAVSAATGKVLWHYTLKSGPVGSAVVVGDTVYIGSDENTVYAFDAQSGRLKWSSQLDHLHALPRSDNQRVFVGAVSANTVLVGSEDGYVVGLQADTGAFRWYYQTSGLYTAPTVTQGETVYVQSNYPDTAVIDLSALRIQSGHLLWKTSLGQYAGPTIPAPPTPGITPHLPGIPSFTVADVRQYLQTHTFPGLDTSGTPTITFTNYKDALGLVGMREGVPGEASAPNPMDKELVCMAIWKHTSYDSSLHKTMQNTSYVMFSANTGMIMQSGSSGGPG